MGLASEAKAFVLVVRCFHHELSQALVVRPMGYRTSRIFGGGCCLLANGVGPRFFVARAIIRRRDGFFFSLDPLHVSSDSGVKLREN